MLFTYFAIIPAACSRRALIRLGPLTRLKLRKRTVAFYLFLETSVLLVPVGMFLGNQIAYPLRDHMVVIGTESQRFIVVLCKLKQQLKL